jgi:hypothetical protein
VVFNVNIAHILVLSSHNYELYFVSDWCIVGWATILFLLELLHLEDRSMFFLYVGWVWSDMFPRNILCTFSVKTLQGFLHSSCQHPWFCAIKKECLYYCFVYWGHRLSDRYFLFILLQANEYTQYLFSPYKLCRYSGKEVLLVGFEPMTLTNWVNALTTELQSSYFSMYSYSI